MPVHGSELSKRGRECDETVENGQWTQRKDNTQHNDGTEQDQKPGTISAIKKSYKKDY